MALANEVTAWESTAALDFHPSRVGSGMGYRKRGTLGGLPNGRSKTSVDEYRIPMTPLSVKKLFWTVIVSSVWREMRLGSHIVRWSIHDA